MTIVLAGNPNSGKTTLFNELTGTSQHTGNYPGVTVDIKEGNLRLGGRKIKIVDLPGIYSLDPDTMEQRIARDYLNNNDIDLIINVVDAGNLERSLFLSIQLIKTRKPILMALNMMDEVEKTGGRIDTNKLQFLLGIHTVPVSAARHRIADLQKHISDVLDGKLQPVTGPGLCIGCTMCKNNENLFEHLEDIVRQVYIKEATPKQKDVTKKLDRVLLNRWLAIPIFFLIMLGIFYLTFSATGWLSNLIKDLLNNITIPALASGLQSIATPAWLTALLCGGILPGVGSVLTFLPQIAVLFILMSILEDSGYMARAAYIMDRAFTKIGLGGGAFMPLLMGFGCSVPGVMAARALPTEKERKLTIMLVPFMSCSARMPLYALLAGAFFTANQGLVIFSVYVIGVIVAVLSGFILNKLLFKTSTSAFIMEIPPYRLPSAKSIALHSWEKVRGFLSKAGTVLLGASILIWVLQYFTPSFTQATDPSTSLLAVVGKAITPVFAPIGLADWRASVALVTGVAAKEAIVSTMGVLTGSGAGGLTETIRSIFTPLQAYVMMVFALLYMPCIAAIAAIRKEMHSFKWTALTLGYSLVTAYIVCLIIFNLGRLVGL